MRQTTQVCGLYPKDEDKFKGEYLAILGKKIIAHSLNLKDILSIINKYPTKAFITKVPSAGWKEAMVL